MSLLNKKAVKGYAKERGRRVGKDFFVMLEEMLERKLSAACREHNGGKVTLDNGVGRHIGLLK